MAGVGGAPQAVFRPRQDQQGQRIGRPAFQAEPCGAFRLGILAIQQPGRGGAAAHRIPPGRRIKAGRELRILHRSRRLERRRRVGIMALQHGQPSGQHAPRHCLDRRIARHQRRFPRHACRIVKRRKSLAPGVVIEGQRLGALRRRFRQRQHPVGIVAAVNGEAPGLLIAQLAIGKFALPIGAMHMVGEFQRQGAIARHHRARHPERQIVSE